MTMLHIFTPHRLWVKFVDLLTNYLRWPTILEGTIASVLGYVILVRLLRWCRYNAIHREYKKKYQDGTITPSDAQRIILVSTSYDMPLLFTYSLGFAQFKTFAIPSISKLLAATGEFTSEEMACKRYADTEILFATWTACPISGFVDPNFKSSKDGQPADDPRAMIAIARVNWIHSHYRISNEDYLYSLCLFVLEPARWAKRYGWRELSPIECLAFYVLWAEIGRRMGIQDIPESFEAMIAWSQDYEIKKIAPSESNKALANFAIRQLLYAIPTRFGLRRFAERMLICFLEDRVRIAMMQPAQPWIIYAFAHGFILAVFWIIQGWFLLPRLSPSFKVNLSKGSGQSGSRLYPNRWTVCPWYKPERTGLGYLRDKFLVSVGWHSEMPGPHLKSSGYRLEELGPTKYENAGHEKVMQMAAELLGCPIAGPWSLEGRHADEESIANDLTLR